MNYEIAVVVFFINIEILIKAFLEQMDFLFFSIFATPFEMFMGAMTKLDKKDYRYRTALYVESVVGWNLVLYLLLSVLFVIITLNTDKEIGYLWFWPPFVVLSALLWVCVLKVPLFYEDHIEICFPLCPFRRTIRIEYENLEDITFYSPGRGDDFMRFHLKTGTPRFKKYVRICCDAPVRNHSARKDTRMNYLYLCRFLKQKGVAVRSNTDQYDRLELAFGPGDRYIPRMSVAQRKEEGKSMLLLLIIVGLWFALMMGFMLSLVQW